MKKKTKQAGPAAWLRENKWTCAVLAAALVLLIVGRLLAAPARVEAGQPEERADYESAVVEQVLSDSTEKDPAADNGYKIRCRDTQLCVIAGTKSLSSTQHAKCRLAPFL